MAVSNRDRVESVLVKVNHVLSAALVPVMVSTYGQDWWSFLAARAEGKEPQPGDAGRRITLGLAKDAPSWSVEDAGPRLWALMEAWDEVAAKVSVSDRRSVETVFFAAADLATGERFTSDRCERVLVEAEELVRALGDPAAADSIEDARRDFRRVRFEEDQRRLQRETQKTLDVQIDSGALPSWRSVVEPHDDVARGTFQLAQFAADLRLVHQGKAGSEYADPVEFFSRTYLTRGLSDLLRTTVRRMAGSGGDPVVDLMTTFGGGKTHSLLAVYHACSGKSADELDGMRELCDEADVSGLPDHVNRVVIVGNDLSVRGSVKGDGTRVNTMWGEIAWQLGGADGYELVREDDEGGSPPTTTLLDELLNKYSPCVILIDEWVAYLRQLWSAESVYPAGTFDAHQTFVQSLTEATKNAPQALLVVSLPASDSVRDMGALTVENAHEIGGTAGLEALRGLRSVIHRVETPWQPATTSESYEIVRRRLFKPFGREQLAARDLVVSRFKEHYTKHMADVPTDVREFGYERSLRDAYPIHPELFERLYEDWSTLERFQRTRGVLRLMATVVHSLWSRGDAGAVILPANVPLEDKKVVEELGSHLDDRWGPVIDTDLAGPTSTAAGVDRDIPLLGRTMAGQRAARALFLGSAPTANRRDSEGKEVVNRGIEQKRVVLGATYPGDNPAHVADALRQIAERGSYVNRDGDRYSLSLSQNLAQLARSRADSYHDDEILETLTSVMREEKDKGVFARVHRMPATSADVEDTPTAGLVVFGPDRPFRKAGSGKPLSPAEATIHDFLQRRGTAARIHKNALVFAAPDADRCDTLLRAVRSWKAWKSVVDGADDLNLAPNAVANARSREDQARQTMRGAIKEAYRWVLNPAQDAGAPEMVVDAIFMNGDGTIAERVTRKANDSELIYSTYPVSFLRRWIDQLNLWTEDTPHVELGKVTGYFADYVYMPRLVGPEVLVETVRQRPDSTLAVTEGGLAYADYVDEAGKYQGLSFDRTHHVQPSGLLVDPLTARRQVERDQTPDTGPSRDEDEPTTTDDPVVLVDPDQPGPPSRTGDDEDDPGTRPSRMYAAKAADPVRFIRDSRAISEEIVSHFTDVGANITLHIEVSSDELDKLDDDVIAALRTNLEQMGFTDTEIR